MNLRQKYQKEVIPLMKEKFGYKNNLAVPKIEKVVVNVGLSRAITEKDPKYIDSVKESLKKITGQKPIETLSRQSISGFKIRKGMVVGLMVTLRGNRLYDFLDKLINAALPRTRDFRGLSLNSVDKSGNLSIGVREHLIFPEIRAEDVQKTHGLEIIITTTAKNREKGLELLKLLGFPFREK
ncbi:MAG: 50S ribosomal protein L5 [Patescibacteria group bacterium]